MDIFAQIAKGGIQGRLAELVTPQPPQLSQYIVPLAPGAFTPDAAPAPMHTAQQLTAALAALRAQYAPFLRRLAPHCATAVKSRELKEFTWYQKSAPQAARVAGVAEQTAAKKQITLPHYEGPLGNAICVYETTFFCEAVGPAGDVGDERVFIRFLGADYKAAVFVNGALAGTHEGFFAAFSFDVTALVHAGENTLRVELQNDYVMLGSKSEASEETLFGDKLYAATGPGYDDPLRGWHHCPPGMGLFDKVYIDTKPAVFVSDIFTRTLEDEIEAWVEIVNCDYTLKPVTLRACLYGENHSETVFEGMEITPSTEKAIGLGDTFTEVRARRENTLGAKLTVPCAKGRNLFKFRFSRAGLRLWTQDAPYLYQLQVSVLDAQQAVLDTGAGVFGVRTFTQENDAELDMRGMFYLNGEAIRLRGANTMGFEQQDIMRGDLDRLIDDMLLAKLCNMNFLRLTQRPVQKEVYDVCSRLGLMTQTDLPLFGCLRRPMFCEAVRQAEEMERHVRAFPCNVVVSYINEPFPNANNQPNMNLTRSELEQFFDAADIVVLLNNPDRIIKHVDGDYDPPSKRMPDNHCYPLWYNGHGIDIGRLHRGHWMPVKPGWYYGCGEFGCEGLEDKATMLQRYPAHWLPQSAADEAAWDAGRIVGAQTDGFYHFFYEQQRSMDAWIAESQKFQGFATRLMTEAYRRDARMVTFAIHLFIDAFPSGWMKTIMDCERRPKPAYFAYRDALSPVLVSLRTDRFALFEGDTLAVESWLCNDTHQSGVCEIRYELYRDGAPCAAATAAGQLAPCAPAYVHTPSFALPKTGARSVYTLKALAYKDGVLLHQNSIDVDVYPACEAPQGFAVKTLSDVTAADLARCETGGVLYVEAAAPGEYTLLGEALTVKESGMSPMHFAARDTGHPWVEGFTPYDFRYWYAAAEDCIAPLAAGTFTCGALAPVLQSRNLSEAGDWQREMLLGETPHGAGRIVVSQIPYARMLENPAGKTLLSRIAHTAPTTKEKKA